ncbi:MAG: MBL fold metallo-hydrolase [Dehalococcoidia bacterium]|nr:MBL fold metallo-hydrolase [Dehalococcoidia bacterium]
MSHSAVEVEPGASRLSAQFTLGSLRVAALSDGAPDRALGGFFHGVEAAQWTQALGITDPEAPLPFNFGTFLVRDGQRTILIDSGFGGLARTMGIPGGGELLARIEELGVRREEIDAVVHTHLHPDHCGTNVTDEGELTFPNAQIVLAQAELDYWMSGQGAEAESQDRAAAAHRNILPYQAADRVRTFDGEHEVSPGLTAVPTPGHTPGHTSFMLASGGQHLLITGDAAHHPVHFEHHDWIPAVDFDPAESTRSRGRLSALAVERDALVTGGHFPILTLGRVRPTATGYAWEYVHRSE